MTAPPNIVLLVLDSVRYDAVGPPGGGFADTPFLDELGAENVSFQRAYAPAPWTVPSHASMFTGVYPTEHQTSHGGKKFLNPEYPTLAEQLRDAGYYTELYTNNVHLVPEFGFTRGFDDITRGPLVSGNTSLIDWNEFIENREHESGLAKYIEILQHVVENRDKKVVESLKSGLQLKAQHHKGDSGAKDAVKYFENRDAADQPTFTFINLMEAHNPFRPPEKFREYEPLEVDGWKYELGERSLSERDLEALHALYHGEIEYLDEMVRRLYESLTGENTIFVVTSDHGVSLGEHQKLYHGSCLYDTTIHVPLIIDGVERADDIETPVGIIGLYRTLLELAGMDIPPYVRGTNVLRPEEEDVLAEMHGSDNWLERHARENHGEEKAEMVAATRRALICLDEKLIRNETTGETELYDLNAGATETQPLPDPARADALEKKLNDIIDSFTVRKNRGEQQELDQETRNKLKDLGYMK